jgi:hypothetical protein
MDGTCGTFEGSEGTHKGLVGKPEGKRLLGRPRHVYGRVILKWGSRNVMGACTGLVWLKIGAGGGLL